MKEKLYTIPINDAVNQNDECPFCFIERKLEHDALDFVLGSAYMEPDFRDITDEHGFCKNHYKEMFQYGNALGNALMLKTYYLKLNKELDKQLKSYSPAKLSFKQKLKSSKETVSSPLTDWIKAKDCDCYICSYINEYYEQYMNTFLYLLKNDNEFFEKIKNSKGFCLHHFGSLTEHAEVKLNDKEKEKYMPVLFDVMKKNMQRMFDDISWFVDKFDYRNKDADWKTSKDAVQRGMQKLVGSYIADEPYKKNQ
ncbi:MAG: hypothetical protein IJM37_03710 [Lachnospiraceae bacterium]|nr:hypothetical protein [Lachnospiraceae bacterium]